MAPHSAKRQGVLLQSDAEKTQSKRSRRSFARMTGLHARKCAFSAWSESYTWSKRADARYRRRHRAGSICLVPKGRSGVVRAVVRLQLRGNVRLQGSRRGDLRLPGERLWFERLPVCLSSQDLREL